VEAEAADSNSGLYDATYSYTMQSCGVMIKSVTAIYRFCLFKVDGRHEYKWFYKTIIATLSVQTCPYNFKCAVLPSDVHPSAPFITIPGFPVVLKASACVL